MMSDTVRDEADEKHARKVRDASCGGQGGGCLNPLCLDCYPPSTDTEEARDYLDEAERIVAGTSRLIAERAHLDALATALGESKKDDTKHRERTWALSAMLGLIDLREMMSILRKMNAAESLRFAAVVEGFKPDVLARDVALATPSGETREGADGGNGEVK